MSTVEEENEIVDNLVIVMRGKLRANHARPGWLYDSPKALLAALRNEVDELEKAIEQWYSDGGSENYKAPGRVVQEAADVANFAAMIADVATSKGPDDYE